MVDQKVISRIHENIKQTHDVWKEEKNTNCYMFAANIDMNVGDIFSDDKFCIGSLSDTYKEDMNANDMIKSLFLDMDKIGVNISKYNNEQIMDDEWLIALFNNDINNDFHFLRTYPKIYNAPHTWYQKKGFNGNITHTDSSRNDIVDPKTADIKVYKCMHLIIPYKYVDTFKLSIKKDF